MRTLFLYGILVALAVIATKEPGETGLEAARGLADKATDVASEIKATVEAVPEVALVLDRVPETDQETDRKFSDPIGDTTNDRFEVEHVLENNETDMGEGLQFDFEEDAGFNEEVNAIREVFASSSDLPSIESAPVTPVVTENVSAEPFFQPSSAKTIVATPVFSGNDFAEVKDFYENASRLLAEME